MDKAISKETPVKELKSEFDVYLYICDKYKYKGIDFDYTELEEYIKLVESIQEETK